jgi:hypothetical protein
MFLPFQIIDANPVTQFRLPHRPSGPYLALGIICTLFSDLIAWGMIEEFGRVWFLDLFFGLFFLLFFIPSTLCWMAYFGGSWLEVTIRNKELVVTEYVWFMYLSWRRNLGQIRELLLRKKVLFPRASPDIRAKSISAQIVLKCKEVRELTFGDGYSKEILAQLIQGLAQRVNEKLLVGEENRDPIPVRAIYEGSDFEELSTQPENSRIETELVGKTLTLSVRPRIWSRPKTLEEIGMYLSFLVFFLFFVFYLFELLGAPFPGGAWGLFVVITSIPFGILVIIFRERDVKLICDRHLLIRSVQRWSGKSQEEWNQSEIHDICSTQIPGSKPFRVVLTTTTGDRRTLLVDSQEATRWLATVLRKVLDLPKPMELFERFPNE